MQNKEITCPQCLQTTSLHSNRLVQDACGHIKCRSCLLNDTDYCKQCLKSSNSLEGRNGLPIDKTAQEITDNHTAVICNGRIKVEALLNSEPGVPVSVVKTDGFNNHPTPPDDYFSELPFTNGTLPVESSVESMGRNTEDIKAKENDSSSRRNILVPPHVIIKSDPVCYFCTLCNKTFTTKGHIKYHKYCNGDVKPFKCNKCGKDFILKMQLQTHMWKHEGVKPYKCNSCSKTFSERSKLMRHEALHSTKKGFMCSLCGKSFKVKDSLRVHSLIHKSEKPYTCKVCSAKFSNSSNLKKHLVSHSDEKVHMCDQCGRRFKLKWALSVHRKSHLNARPHVCDICSKGFVNLKDLQRHILIHSEVKQFICSICKVTFRRKDILRRHMKNTHPGKKGEIIRNPLHVSDLPKKSVVIDNPNAVNVITASPALTKCRAVPAAVPVQHPSTISTDSRPTGSVINGPIKLAFKTPAFKSNYNITGGRPFLPPSHLTTHVPLDVPEPNRFFTDNLLAPQKNGIDSVLPINDRPPPPPLPQAVHQDLSAYSSVLHYETSFQSGKHGMIKNIKFKVPAQYTNSFKSRVVVNNNNNNNNRNDSNINQADASDGGIEDKETGSASVIVNNSSASVSSDIHWRRRTSQNLVLKN